ncbi:MAG: HlyC/CorC family transporter [Massilimaliae sp.]|nr:HlyC/CorC family transporter [Massiliimalia sp.]
MDDVGRWCLIIIFSILSFLFCAAETALTNYNENRLEELAEEDKAKKRIAKSILSRPTSRQASWMEMSSLISMLAAGISGFGLAFAGLQALTDSAAKQLENSPAQYWFSVLIAVLAFLITACLVITVTRSLPKRIFRRYPERLLLNAYRYIRGISFLFYPLGGLTALLASGIARLFGCDPKADSEEITEEEIRNLVDAGGENGIIEQEEREMINNIFDFDDKDVSDLMTHRTDIVGLDLQAKISDVVYHAINDGFSRIPVYENDLDNIKGIIYVKDLLCLVGCTSSEDFRIEDFLREAIYVPEAKKCSDLLKIFKTKKAHMAVVVDDYGGTAGIVTMEDLLESIVGNIQDEYDDEQEEIVALEDGSYLLDGAAGLDIIEKRFDIHFHVDEDIDTVGGLITNTLGRIPKDGEQPELTVGHLHFKVLVVNDQRIERAKATVIPLPEESEI